MDGRRFFLISDGPTQALEQVLSQVLAAGKEGAHFRSYANIQTDADLEAILSESAMHADSFLVFFLRENALAQLLRNFCALREIPYLDLLATLSANLRLEIPGFSPSRYRKLSDTEVFTFAHSFDDGKDPQGIHRADICLIGVSRTGKTPLAIYLASKNLRAMNVPLLPEVPLPRALQAMPPQRIFGLTANPKRLMELRRERLKSLGLPADSPYASRERIQDELAYAQGIMTKLGCPMIDISQRAIEEIADIILRSLEERKEEGDE